MSRMCRDDRGQAHILAIFATAIAVLALVAMLVKQEQLLGVAHHDRAGEAAVQAAGALVADEHLALVLSLRDADGGPRDPDSDELLRFVADPGLAERALAAARAIASENGVPAPRGIAIVDRGGHLEVSIDSGVWHRVTIAKVSCCRR